MNGAGPAGAQGTRTRPAARRADPAVLLVVVLALALVLRLAWVLLVEPPVSIVNDTGQYDAFAQNIAQGRGYVTLNGHPTAFWPVGYPAILAAVYLVFGHSVLAGRLLNVALGAATVGLLYLFVRRWWGDRPAALAASAVLALMPGPITFASLLLSETLFTALLVGSLTVLAWRGPGGQVGLGQAVLFGVVAAAAAYVRGQALLLPLVAVGWLVLAGRPWRQSLRFGGLALAVVLLLTLPWAVRNTVRLGEPTFLSTNVGIDLWVGHHEGASGGLDFLDQVAYAARFDHLPPVEAELAINRQGTRDALAYALSHPLDEARLAVLKFVRLYGDDADGLRWNEYYGEHPVFHGYWRWVAYGTVDLFYWLTGALALGGLIVGLRRRFRQFAPLALLFVYWTAVHIAFFAEPRFHVPVLPLFAALAAWAAVTAVRAKRAKRAAGA
ncbi:MAG TPA: glycosyltransferase family 39 protein [Dehalococcoidia bacterium]